MKKTLFLLASLALAASTQAATLWTITFSNTTQTDATAVTLTNDLSGIIGEITDLIGNGNNGEPTDVSNGLLNAGTYDDNGWYTPNYRLNTETEKFWTTTFTFTNNSEFVLSIEDISMDVVALGLGGDVQGSDRGATTTLTLTVDGVNVTGNNSVTTKHSGSTNQANSLVQLDDSITLGVGETMTMKLTVNSSNGQALYGVNNLQFMGTQMAPTPEPATASLSLLGLAALMMRRRRG